MSVLFWQRCTAELSSLRATGRWGLRRQRWSSTRAGQGEGDALNAAHENGTNDAPRETEWPQRTNRLGRINGNASLPLPPFLRDRGRRSRSPFEQHLTRSNKRIKGRYVGGNKHPLRTKLRVAPFATRLQENPYAHMLAESVREERVTGQRIPRSLLLRFTAVEDQESAGSGMTSSKQTQGTASEDGQQGQLTLLPLSLFGEAIPKNKGAGKLSVKESAAAEALGDATAGVESASSYVLARHDVLSRISAEGRRATERVIGNGMRLGLERSRSFKGPGSRPSAVVWRDDMAQMVLLSMRRVVRRHLRHLMRQKASADRPGLMMQVASIEGQGGSLAMLDRIDNVMCVLRLRHSPATDEGLEARRRLEAEAQVEQPIWVQDEEKRLLWGQRSQPAREAEVEARYPTMRYRNRRVPLYSLEHLLGKSQAVAKLVDGTSFAQSEWVTISSSKSTQPLLQWLFRLHSYLAYEPDEVSS